MYDFLIKSNMGDVKPDSGTGAENITWKNAPKITIKGTELRDHNFVDDTGN